ncbi:hypothetical protein OG978_03470 [Streptomyces sp. NBC_01591]|uniref:MmyB family transcriptional regulator n=1 Tax=Streptomyces sp. NBC_01591 TaxID=2975888 RepID=UPI002DD9F7C8|nr:hypothetical protein [Streptomyces sp. NBC_01591]WSD66523.1 hypothetical protein OG978_03470 [Streptomyces sp. NBC_01591]
MAGVSLAAMLPASTTRLAWGALLGVLTGPAALARGRRPAASQLADLVGELTLKSPEFPSWWTDHRVLRRTHGAKSYHHPLVGDLRFSYESFQAPGESDRTLCVYNVEPDSETARSLQLLTSWTAPQPDTLPLPEPTIPPEAAP